MNTYSKFQKANAVNNGEQIQQLEKRINCMVYNRPRQEEHQEMVSILDESLKCLSVMRRYIDQNYENCTGEHFTALMCFFENFLFSFVSDLAYLDSSLRELDGPGTVFGFEKEA